MPHITVGEGFFLTCFQKDGERDFSTRRHKTKKGNKFDLLPKKYFPTVYPYFENPTELDFLVENDRLFVFPSSITDDIRLLKSVLNVRMNGIEAGIWKNEKLLPDHHLAVATITSLQLPEVSLNYEQAIQYLQKKEIQQLHTETLKGWLIVKYDNHRLGWINVLSNRINNYYPMDSRIRKEFVPV
jgi:NOL1/NOP2/fmu family ribosome biogenesis protein